MARTATPTRTRRKAPVEESLSPASSGWPVDLRERGDFYHRPRAFPPEVKDWREQLVDAVLTQRERFPAAPRGADMETVRALVDEGISYLREVSRIAELLYGIPRLGNKAEPVDELIFIILSRKTREGIYQHNFRALKERFVRWEELLAAPREEVVALVQDGGLGDEKTESLIGALSRLSKTFGSCTLEPAREWSDERLEEFLCTLPEMSRKSAYCIMRYSLGRQAFPADTHVGRVLSRLGPYRELGLSLDRLEHKKLQAQFADLVPPPLRDTLHGNLLMHGREVCHPKNPLCGQCELRRFCTYFREAEHARVHASDAPTVIDLFAGAGGLSEGFQRAGFEIVAASDMNEVALKTYWLNHPHLKPEQVLCGDVSELKASTLRKLLGGKSLDVLAGAPPCQGFSMAGLRSKVTRTGYQVDADERNYLFEHLVGLALELKPRLFLMENVPGMQTARKKEDNLSFLEMAKRMLEESGEYRATVWKLHAVAYGVPQERARCFLVAARKGALPAQPAGEYQSSRGNDFDTDALPPVTLEEAIFDLPPLEAGSGTAAERWVRPDGKPGLRHRRYLSKFGLVDASPLLYNHFTRYNNERDLELYALLKPGEDSVHAIERHGRGDLMRYRRDVFDDKYARLKANRPCKTIVAHLAKDGNGYIHPSQTRSLSMREAARVQSFPDSYAFCGSPSDQWVQVGNAVPPVLGEAIARSFLRALRSK